MRLEKLGAVGAASLFALTAGCSAPTPKEPRSTAMLSAAVVAPEAKIEPEALPSACATEQLVKGAKACLPPSSFAKKVCGGIYPEVALAMFTKGTPWTRVWLAGEVEAWNASGGLTHRTTLAFDEEVIVLSRHGADTSGGIVMSGAMASYDVLRWDGTCVSVLEGELTARRPPTPKPAPVTWNRLDEPTRHALLASPKVKSMREALDKACASSEKKACEKADKAFSQTIADFVRGGGSLPPPARRP